MRFYRDAIGAETGMLVRFKESPEPIPEGRLPPGSEDKVMHATLRIGGATIMMSDGRCTGTPGFRGFSLSLDADDDAHARRLFDALSDGGQVQMPLAPTFYASSFGMVTDRFGVSWMVLRPSM
jgi:PhnB protein